MKIKVIIDHLEHDKERVPEGSLLDLPDLQAQALIAAGAALPVGLNGVQTPIKPTTNPKSKGRAGSATKSNKPAPSKASPAAEAEV